MLFGAFCLVVDPERRLVLGIKPVAVADGVANVVLELLHRLLFFAGLGAQFDGTHRHAFVKGRAQRRKRHLCLVGLHVVGLSAHADDVKGHRIDIHHLPNGSRRRSEEIFGHASRDHHHLSAFAQVVFVDKAPRVQHNALHFGRGRHHAVETSLEAVFARHHDQSRSVNRRHGFADLRPRRRTRVFKVPVVDLHIPSFAVSLEGFRSIARHNRDHIVGKVRRIVLKSMDKSVARTE